MHQNAPGIRQRHLAQRALPFLLFVLVSLFSLSARAELLVCNESGVTRSVAIGYRLDGQWTSAGWWNVDNSACATVLVGALKNQYYYFRATSSSAPFEGEGFSFCTDTNAFTITGDENCETRGYSRSDFRQIDTGERATSYTITLIEDAPRKSVSQAPKNQPPASSGRVAAWTNTVYEVKDLPKPIAEIGINKLGCDLADAVPSFGAEIYGLVDGREVYLVACHSGDVNIEYYLVMTDPKTGQNKLYDFENPPYFNQGNRPSIITPTFDPVTMTLSSYTYASPDADCGTFELFQYVAEDDLFELRELREKPVCDGQWTDGASYPLVWSIAEMGD